jgi:hypothetical protein
MRALEWLRVESLAVLIAFLTVLFVATVLRAAHVAVLARRRTAREAPVLRCIRELPWQTAWPQDDYPDRLASQLRSRLGVGARRCALRGATRGALSFEYEGTTWFIAVEDKLPDIPQGRVERTMADLLDDCARRANERSTLAVVVGVPSTARRESNPKLLRLRAALVSCASGARRATRSRTPRALDFNYELVEVPVALEPS